MACKIERPAPQELFNRFKDMFSGAVLGGAPVIPESNEWYVVANDYAVAEEFYAITEQAYRERDPRYACCDNLIAMAARDGVYPTPATFSQGYVKLTGAPNTPLPTTIEIQAGGQNYVSSGNVPANLGTTGSVTIRVRALTPGSAGNAAGSVTTGTLVTPIDGVDTAVQICGGNFCGGAEQEGCEAFRQRYIARMAYKPRSTQAWIQEKLLEWPCSTRVLTRSGSCCECGTGGTDCSDCGCIDCGGQLGFYVMFDGTFPCGIAPQSIIDEISTWMFGANPGYGEGQVEIGVCGSIHVVKPLPVNIRIDIPGCISQTEIREIRRQIAEFFTTISPSIALYTRQISVIIANIIGANQQFDVSIDLIPGYDPSLVYIDPCGNIEPSCDVIPCLNEVEIFGPVGGGLSSPCA